MYVKEGTVKEGNVKRENDTTMAQLIRGKVWYPFYVPRPGKDSLLSHHPLETLRNKLIVSQVNPHHKFTFFNNIQEFAAYQLATEVKDRTFFEYATGARRLYFDLDADLSNGPVDLEGVLDELILVSEKEIRHRGLPWRSPWVYSSHGTEKKSYHVIFPELAVPSHREAKAFYLCVLDAMHHPEKGCVDSAVYTSFQAFRIVGNQKRNTGRIKTPLVPCDDLLTNLTRSLITYTQGCTYLEEFSQVKIQEDIVEDAHMVLIRQWIKEEGNFKVRNIKGSVIALDRLEPGHCSLCNRIHEHESPYLAVVRGKVYFHCRRSELGGKFLGTVELHPEIETTVGLEALKGLGQYTRERLRVNEEAWERSLQESYYREALLHT